MARLLTPKFLLRGFEISVLASLADSRLPPVDQNSTMFFGPRQVVDAHYGGLAFEEEGERCPQQRAPE